MGPAASAAVRLMIDTLPRLGRFDPFEFVNTDAPKPESLRFPVLAGTTP